MASVVFIRGVNVGKHKRFQPAALARELAHLDVVNIGAAGTFVIRKPVGEEELRAQIRQKLPFDAEVMICSGEELLEFCAAPLPDETSAPDARPFLCVLARAP